jgi:guanidinobutyrase
VDGACRLARNQTVQPQSPLKFARSNPRRYRGAIHREEARMTDPFNQPLSGNEMPRFAGIATMFRLPTSTDLSGGDVAITGVPLDIGTSNRNGTRYGPRQIRTESVLVRPYSMATGAAPFDSFQVVDYGDVALNPYSLEKSIDLIEAHFAKLAAARVLPVSLGGDHTITLPILRALAKRHGPLALVHVDAHSDTNDAMFGERITHGAIFRRAIEEGVVDPNRIVQIGMRATGYSANDFDWARNGASFRRRASGRSRWRR